MASFRFRALCAAVMASVCLVAGRAPACQNITRANVVPCALAQSFGVRAERENLAAIAGRRASASLVLPSNPVLSANGGLPVGYPISGDSLTWGVSLSQELEIAGQRGRRLELVAAQRSAAENRLLGAQRELGRSALRAYFDVLSARAREEVGAQLAAVGQALTLHAEARAEAGIDAPITASIARAESVHLARLQLEARLESRHALAKLESLLGGSPRVEGELMPLELGDLSLDQLLRRGLEQRADLEVARAERLAAERRVELLRAERIPNPTLSVHFRKDWIGERVAGIGVSLPIPIARSYTGQIREAEALARRAEIDIEQRRRAVRLEVVTAQQALEIGRQKAALFDAGDSARAREQLAAIAEALRARRLPVRDALLAERALAELWFEQIEAQHELCLASVELAYASGAAL